jgi:hypothetical protein
MQPGSVQTLYRLRRLGLVLACIAPVVVLGGLYLLVTQVLLVPGIPGDRAPGDEVARFIMHPKGLPRLPQSQREAFIQKQMPRLVRDQPLVNAFTSAVRTASPEEQDAFRENMFNTLKPMLVRDAAAWEALPEPRRQALLDERIVAYNRLGARSDVHVSRHDLGAAAPSGEELVKWLVSKTSADERRLMMAYAAALAERVNEILTDEKLKADFERRISGD